MEPADGLVELRFSDLGGTGLLCGPNGANNLCEYLGLLVTR